MGSTRGVMLRHPLFPAVSFCSNDHRVIPTGSWSHNSEITQVILSQIGNNPIWRSTREDLQIQDYSPNTLKNPSFHAASSPSPLANRRAFWVQRRVQEGAATFKWSAPASSGSARTGSTSRVRWRQSFRGASWLAYSSKYPFIRTPPRPRCRVDRTCSVCENVNYFLVYWVLQKIT